MSLDSSECSVAQHGGVEFGSSQPQGEKVPPGLAFAGVIVPVKPAAQKTLKTPQFVKAASFFLFFLPFRSVDWF